jgi:hypothetical protein
MLLRGRNVIVAIMATARGRPHGMKVIDAQAFVLHTGRAVMGIQAPPERQDQASGGPDWFARTYRVPGRKEARQWDFTTGRSFPGSSTLREA